MNARPKLRVAIVYQYVAHYREPIFKRLSADKEIEYTIFSDIQSNIDSLKVVNFENSDSNNVNFIRHRRLKNIWIFGKILWQKGLISLSFAKTYDVIIYLGDPHYLSTWIGSMIARLRGKRVLFWGHGVTRYAIGIRALIKRIYFRIPHGHLLYGFIARDYLGHFGFDLNSLYVVYNSLDFKKQTEIYSHFSEERVQAIRKELFEEPNRPLLVSMGRIDRMKRLDILVDAVEILRQQGFATNLLVIGDGSDRKKLELAAAGSGSAKSIKFMGAIYGEANLGELIGSADLCVVPGPVGLVIIHAFGYGIPVITHDNVQAHNPEFEVMAPNLTGDLFEEGNAGSLAHVVRQWLERHSDRAEIARRCRHAIETFYNPAHQHKVIDHAVRGLPASDLPSPDGTHRWIMQKSWPATALDALEKPLETSAR